MFYLITIYSHKYYFAINTHTCTHAHMKIAVVYSMSLFTPKQNNANQNNSKMVFGVALIKNKSSVAVGLGMIKAHIQNQADGNG